ncbi:MAG: pantoate--beta-alanine ligase [Candidatus Eremiobacteraeota bacterium]|nr:pantoate--beta-alanine ligase [Candidatus Eremiobacteraeota bacterium]
MIVLKTPQEMRSAIERMDRPLGFVATMGALHSGHQSLLEASRAECKSTVASVFVNPMQFAPGEDLERYPREPQSDLRLLEKSGINAVFAPEPEAMFPEKFSTSIDVGYLATCFEGIIRPGHFRGVATVVVKLCNIVAPNVVFFGQKDAQQIAVVRKLVRELNVGVEVRLVPTVREIDGLALSSRNRYLTQSERRAAPSLYAALQEVYSKLLAGRSRAEALGAGKEVLHPMARLDYMELVDAETFERLEFLRPPAFIIGAAAFGTTRLIDNIWVAA